MEGTERQVEWAEKIKQGIKREAEEYLQEMKNRQKAAEELSGFDAIADLRWSLKQ
jgi:heme-degrading monooxygenase HmoA